MATFSACASISENMTSYMLSAKPKTRLGIHAVWSVVCNQPAAEDEIDDNSSLASFCS